jgi:hypothetical protein
MNRGPRQHKDVLVCQRLHRAVSLPVSLLIALRPFLRLRLDLLLVVLAVRGGMAGVAVRVLTWKVGGWRVAVA